MSRRQAREMALQALFGLDFNTTSEPLQAIFAEHEKSSTRAKEYAGILVKGTQEHLLEIDAMIGEISKDWKVQRMNSVDRNIVRMAIYEMKFGEEQLSPNVVINEAVELAKSYGTEDSGRFVNGILGSLIEPKDKC